MSSLLQAKQLEPVLLCYLAALASYKLFYILNWVHRYYDEVRSNLLVIAHRSPSVKLLVTAVLCWSLPPAEAKFFLNLYFHEYF